MTPSSAPKFQCESSAGTETLAAGPGGNGGVLPGEGHPQTGKQFGEKAEIRGQADQREVPPRNSRIQGRAGEEFLATNDRDFEGLASDSLRSAWLQLMRGPHIIYVCRLIRSATYTRSS